MFSFWSREGSIINKIKAYLEQMDLCRDRFRRDMEELIKQEARGKKEAERRSLHQAESRADDLRRDVERHLYQKSLIPESRGDVLGLLETLDVIPGLFQSLVDQLSLQKLVVPEAFRERLWRLVQVNLEAYNLICQALLGFFYKSQVRDRLEEIDRQESESDGIERSLIKDIFESSLEKEEKILLKQIVINIGDISDLAEAAKDRLALAIIKRGL